METGAAPPAWDTEPGKGLGHRVFMWKSAGICSQVSVIPAGASPLPSFSRHRCHLRFSLSPAESLSPGLGGTVPRTRPVLLPQPPGLPCDPKPGNKPLPESARQIQTCPALGRLIEITNWVLTAVRCARMRAGPARYFLMNPARCFPMIWLREFALSPGRGAHAAQPSCWGSFGYFPKCTFPCCHCRVFNVSRHGSTNSISRRHPKQSPFPCLSYLDAHRWFSIFPSFF